MLFLAYSLIDSINFLREKIKSYINNIPLSNGVGETTIEDFSDDVNSKPIVPDSE